MWDLPKSEDEVETGGKSSISPGSTLSTLSSRPPVEESEDTRKLRSSSITDYNNSTTHINITTGVSPFPGINAI